MTAIETKWINEVKAAYARQFPERQLAVQDDKILEFIQFNLGLECAGVGMITGTLEDILLEEAHSAREV